MIKKKVKDGWVNVYKYMTKEGIERSFFSKREYALAKDKYTATVNDDFYALSISVRDRIIERWIDTQQKYHKQNMKRVYYLSMEFLIGRLLGTNMLNLNLFNEVKSAMDELGLNLETIRECESDAGLGNGGLGRLAACFLDSMATLGIPAHGYGIRYDYGIFNQKIINGYQVEFPDKWLAKGNPWEFQRLEYSTKIKYYGRTYVYKDNEGKDRVAWVDTEDLIATPYDIPIVGYKSDVVNTLRLWSARSSEEFDFRYFNDGDYEKAVYNKVFSENISKVLYPNDSMSQGRELRLKQEYFFTAASIADIIRRFKVENNDIRQLPEKVTIQLNDTHPAIAIVELFRILLDHENLDWNTAWDITVRTFAYTNHTVMPEALETWAIPMFEKILPRHMQLIYEINMHFLKQVAMKYPGDVGRMGRMSLIEEGDPKKIRMAYLSIVGSHSINGVSKLHSELIKTSLFRDFHDFYPERFNNKTNGITQRRWLAKANMKLSDLITDTIGEKWIVDASELKKLLNHRKDQNFRKKWQDIKRANKEYLAKYIIATTGISVDPESMFDVQIKRIHEYKRQHLFALYMISQYLRIKNDPKKFTVPRTYIISGKAAPGYALAKLIIKFINSIADVVNNDRAVNDKMKVVFLENYRVSLAEKIFPASDLSEQISTAGTEASGTGCMKFMMNGALTIGTYDGANIEMAEAAGEENMFLFGLKVNDIENLQRSGYNPQDYINNSPVLREVLQLVQNNFFSPMDHGLFNPILGTITYGDRYFLAADFDSYCATQQKLSDLYKDKNAWLDKAIANVARSGVFSSDRTIREYCKDIWDIKV